MKKIICTICLLLSVAILLSVSVSAEESSPYSSIFFGSYDSFIDVINNYRMEIWFDVVTNGTMDEVGVSSVVVERSSDGSTWTEMKEFLPENYSQMVCENTYFNYDYVPYYGIPGYYYRAYVTFYAKDSRGRGYAHQYSEVVRLPPL